MSNPIPRIIFVDDEADVLSGIKRALRKNRMTWDMQFSTSAQQALATCAQSQCQVVVTDLMMPGVNGIDLVRQLNQEYPDTRCIMLSGTADLQDAAKLINTTRIFRFFSKPCDPGALISGIQDALKQVSASKLEPTISELTDIFGLTGSEARLTRALVLGNSLEVSAETVGITPASARTYLKRVFSKTETNRQAELVSKVLFSISR